MLKIGRVIATWGKDDRDTPTAVHLFHHRGKQTGIVAVFGHGILGKGLWRHLACNLAGYHRITGTRGDTQVVLQYIPLSVLAFDEVDACDVGIDLSCRTDAFTFRHIALRGIHELLGYDTILDDALVVIDIP